MEEKYFELNRFYEPNWFHMFVADFYDRDLNFDNCNDKQLGVYAHEYGHYLQNILTIGGVRNAIEYYKFVYRLKKNLEEQQKVSLPISYELINQTDKNRLEKYHLLKGADFLKNKKFNRVDFSKVLNESGIEILTISFYNDSSSDSIGHVSFGFLCVKEGMCRAIQKEFDSELDHPFYPYKLSELLVEHFCPSILHDHLKIAALSSLALNFENSGMHFFRLLEEYNQVQKSISITEFIKSELNDKKVVVNGVPNNSLKELYALLIEELKSTLGGFLSSKLDFFSDLIENMHITSNNYDMAFFEILSNGLLSKTQKLNHLKAFYGVPVIQLGDSSLVFPFAKTETGIHPELVELLTVKSLFSRLFEVEKSTRCRLFAFCSNSEENNMDHNCDSTQWLRTEICPMLQAMEFWQLRNKLSL